MSPPHVLVVEDEPALAELYATWLDDYTTTVAQTGQEALEALDRHGNEFDVVLLDRRIPEPTGDAVVQRIRKRGLGCSVAMVTAVDPGVDIIQLGFDDYITKPVTEPEVRDTVERLAGRADYDETVREHLALISKRSVLEAELDRAALESSEEYARLEAEIEASRERLDDTLAGDVFVELLLGETRDWLYVVLQYDADTYRYRYVSDPAEELIAAIDPDLNEVLDQFRAEGRQKSRLGSVLGLDSYDCSLHLFDEVVFFHFYQSDDRGIVCGFDPDTAEHLTDFVSLVRPYLRHVEMGGDERTQPRNRGNA